MLTQIQHSACPAAFHRLTSSKNGTYRALCCFRRLVAVSTPETPNWVQDGILDYKTLYACYLHAVSRHDTAYGCQRRAVVGRSCGLARAAQALVGPGLDAPGLHQHLGLLQSVKNVRAACSRSTAAATPEAPIARTWMSSRVQTRTVPASEIWMSRLAIPDRVCSCLSSFEPRCIVITRLVCTSRAGPLSHR
jgi:hypothetical protein